MKNIKKKKGIFREILVFSSIIAFIFKIIKVFLGKEKIKSFDKNFKRFEKEELDEMHQWLKGEETSKRYWHDSLGIFQKYFIPNEKNHFKPFILRTKSLITIAFILTLCKLMILSYVFFIIPFEAWMSEVITNKVIELVNQDREAQNLEKLIYNPILSASALAKANDMIEKGYFAHFTPDGKKPWDFINRNEYPYLYVGENLAMNFTNADSVHTALMNSPTHKKNIMNSKYTEIGIAMVTGEIEGKTTNILVEFFAAKSNSDNTQTLAKTVPEVEIEKTVEEKVENKEIIAYDNQTVKQEETKKEILPKTITEVAGMQEQFSSETIKNKIPELVEDFDRMENLEALVSSPNHEYETLQENQIIKMPNTETPKLIFISNIIKSSNYIFAISLFIMILALIFNIFFRFKVQHKPIIIQTMILLLFLTGLLYWQIDLDLSNFEDILIL